MTTEPIERISSWRYEDSGTDLGSSWRELTFDDSSWEVGQALFHAGDEPGSGLEAEVIDTLFSTGVSEAGVPLPPGTTDPHWFETDTGDPLLTMAPNPAWIDGTNSSQWTGVVSSGSTNVPPGNYSFSTQFDLSDYDISTATLSIMGAVDNSLGSVLLNGVRTGISFAGFGAFQGPFTIHSGWVQGINILEFNLINSGTSDNPSGLHVQFDSSAVPLLGNTQVDEGPNTHYFRQEFTYSGDPAASHTIELDAQFDDGAIFYLNGTEVHRQNMPAGLTTYATIASANTVSPMATGRIILPGDALNVAGNNVLAVEVHQGDGDTDVWFGSQLFVVETPAPPNPQPRLALSEIDSAESGTFFIELVNQGETSLDPSDFFLRTLGVTETDHPLPSQVLAPGDYVAYDVSELNGLPSDADRVFLMEQATQRVLDARKITDRLQGRSSNHGDRWLYPSAATPGVTNLFSLHEEIVINEIFYHAPPKVARPGNLVAEVLVAMDDPWRYNQEGDDLGPLWQRIMHPVNGADWFSGPGLLAYEGALLSAPIGTTLDNPQTNNPPVVTYYFEKDFDFSGDPSNPDLDLKLRHWIDDGAIFYLNGKEISRFNMPTGAVTSGTFSASGIENAVSVGPIEISSEALVQGTNRLSVEVHQATTTSSDIVFGVELISSQTVGAVPFEKDALEWIELYHRGGSPVDLSGWRVEGGVDFVFPSGTVMAPGDYLVLTDDAATFSQQVPGIDVLGGLERRLSNQSDLIRLVDGFDNRADQVHYFEDGRWPSRPDGRGSSLELRDAWADNSKGEAWAASVVESAPWQTVTYRGWASEPPGSNNPEEWQEFIFGLLDEGEILVDDVSVIEDPDGVAIERIQNGSFESDPLGSEPAAWRLVGNHGQHGLSGVITEPGNPTNQVLHLLATGGTEHMSNHVETTFAGGASIVDGGEYEVSMRVRWLSGSPQLHTRFYFNRMARTTVLQTPDPYTLGTPGEINSTSEANIGPTYDQFAHAPAVPQEGQPVTVRVHASDDNGVAAVMLWYSVNEGAFQSMVMAGSAAGTYEATIPGQHGEDVVQFYVEGIDLMGANSQFPAKGQDSRALYQVDNNTVPDGPQHTFRIIMTGDDYNQMLEPIRVMTNHRMGATIVFNDRQVYYDVGVRLKGSGFSRGSGATGFNLRFPADSRLFGVHDIVSIDRQGGVWGVGASHRELTLKHIANHAGDIPMMMDDAIYVVAPNAALNGTGQLLAARYDDVFLDSQYENGSDGTRYKFELVYYSTRTQSGDLEDFKLPPGYAREGVFPVLAVDIVDMGEDPNAYRWNYLIRSNRDEDDYSRIINMAKAFSQDGSAVDGPLDVASQEAIDVDQWMRLFAFESLVGMVDTYNQGLAHNLQFYVRPADNRVLALPWDLDFSWYRSTSASIYGDGNSELTQIINIPSNRRLFQGHLLDIISTTYNLDYLAPWIEHIATRSVEDNSTEIADYLTARRAYVLGQLMPEVTFSITTHGGADFGVTTNTVDLAGAGWIDVREIRLAGSSLPLGARWTDDHSWQVAVPLVEGANPIVLEAYNFQGDLVASDTITVTTTLPNPVEESLRLTEIMYHPTDPTSDELAVIPGLDNDDFEFLEFVNAGTATINLAGVQIIDGVSFAFPDVELTVGQHVVVVRDRVAFELRYGSGPAVIGEFASGQLSNGGESIVVALADGTPFIDFIYDDLGDWPGRADGTGSSLEVIDTARDYQTSANWRSSNEYGGSPGLQGTGPVYDVFINELLSHSDGAAPDLVELTNITDSPIDLSQWTLSDTDANLFLFQIPDGTTLAPGQYTVFNESQLGFALDGQFGDELWLLEADPTTGKPLRFADHVKFDATDTDVSLGRWANADPASDLFPMTAQTFGYANSGPVFDDLLISEVHYHPASVPPAEVGNIALEELEFLELVNVDSATRDISQLTTDGIGFVFPAGTVLAAGEAIVLVTFDPVLEPAKEVSFRNVFGIGSGPRLFGPASGRLDNAGERVKLLKPEDPVTLATGDVLVDAVRYGTGIPWPLSADGGGDSLHRLSEHDYGGFVSSWIAAPPSPGLVPFVAPTADFDQDLDIDGNDFLAWQRGFGKSSSATQADGDADHDADVDGEDLLIWESQFGGEGQFGGTGLIQASAASPEVATTFYSGVEVVSAPLEMPAWQDAPIASMLGLVRPTRFSDPSAVSWAVTETYRRNAFQEARDSVFEAPLRLLESKVIVEKRLLGSWPGDLPEPVDAIMTELGKGKHDRPCG